MPDWQSIERGGRATFGTLGNFCPWLYVQALALFSCLGAHNNFYLVDSTSTTFQPFFLDFYKVHSLATYFFLRMWSESGAAFGDFTRVVALVRSQYVLLIFPLLFVVNSTCKGQSGSSQRER
jgi:hypothetical protein